MKTVYRHLRDQFVIKVRVSKFPRYRRFLTSPGRCGTHWLKGMIGDVMQIAGHNERLLDPEALGTAMRQTAYERLCHEHFRFDLHSKILDPKKFPDLKMVLLYRNPLDAEYSNHVFKNLRNQSLNRSQTIESFKERMRHLDQSQQDLDNDSSLRSALKVKVVDWIRAGWVHTVKYEDLVADTPLYLSRVLDYLAVPYTTRAIERTLKRRCFKKLSQGRERGDENIHHHYRKGTPGEWREVYDAELLDVMQRHLGDYMPVLGYPMPSVARTLVP